MKDIKRHVFPTLPSPTTTHFIGREKGNFAVASFEAIFKHKKTTVLLYKKCLLLLRKVKAIFYVDSIELHLVGIALFPPNCSLPYFMGTRYLITWLKK